jgi:hypothetical protein
MPLPIPPEGVLTIGATDRLPLSDPRILATPDGLRGKSQVVEKIRSRSENANDLGNWLGLARWLLIIGRLPLDLEDHLFDVLGNHKRATAWSRYEAATDSLPGPLEDTDTGVVRIGPFQGGAAPSLTPWLGASGTTPGRGISLRETTTGDGEAAISGGPTADTRGAQSTVNLTIGAGKRVEICP